MTTKSTTTTKIFDINHIATKDDIKEIFESRIKANAVALINKLRWAVLLAKHAEPTRRADVDEDTGVISYYDHVEQDVDIREMLALIEWDEDAKDLFVGKGWNPDLCRANYDTLLAVLPPHPFETKLQI